MRRFSSIATLVAIVATGCAHSDSGLGKAKVALSEPEVTVIQISTIPNAARNMAGSIPVRFAIRVQNTSGEVITLKRVELNSVGQGAYDLRNAVSPFEVKIAPGQTQTVEIPAMAVVSDPTIIGANGPVTIRSIASFDSGVGQFQKITVGQVHASEIEGTP